MKNTQNGFAHFSVVILLVIVLGLIGIAGWKVIYREVPTKSSTANTVEPVATKKNEIEVEHESAPVLNIKEWNVSIPLSSVHSGAYYTINKNIEQSSTDPTNLTIYSKEADALIGPTGKSCKNEYIAYLLRLPADDPTWQPSTSVDDGNVSPLFGERIVVGNYRYAIATYKGYGPVCLATSDTGDYKSDPVTTQKFGDIVKSFESDFKKIRAN